MTFLRSLVLFAVIVCLIAPLAQAQSASDDIERLRNDVKDLQKHLYRQQTGNTAKGSIALTDIDERLRDIYGQIEELNHAQRQQEDRITQLEQQIETLISQNLSRQTPVVAQNIDAPKEQALESNTSSSSPSQLPTTPTDLYNLGLSMLGKKEYRKAQTIFSHYITSYPQSDLLAHVYYWLGEAHALQENHQQAAIEFLKGYKEDPKGKKAPLLLLKLGASLFALDKPKDACATFAKIHKEFKELDESLTSQLRANEQSANCS